MKIDWENVTNYLENVGSVDKVFSFPRAQSAVQITNRGSANLIYTIGSQSGTLTPTQSVKVTETISSFTLRSSSGSQLFECWGAEAGTEQDEPETDLASLASSLADKATKNSKYDDLSFPMPKSPIQNTLNSNEKFYFEPLFYLNGTDVGLNFQSLAYHDGYVYVGYSIDNTNGIIHQYDTGGQDVKNSGTLPFGHTAGLVYRNSNNHIYVANGGDVQPSIYEVDMAATTPSILSTLNLTLGQNAIIAIDNVNDLLILHTAPTIVSGTSYGSHTFYTLKFDGTFVSQFTIPNQGIPQGIAYYQNQIYLYINQFIVVIDMTGKIIQTIPLSKSGESEGICIAADYAGPYIIVGYNNPNRLYALRSTDNQAQYHSFHPFNSVNRQDTGATALLPTIATLAINNNAGLNAWAVASWGNGFNWSQIVKSITSTTGSTGAISVKFVHPIKSVGYFACDENFKLTSLGYSAKCNFTDPDTLVIQIYNASGTQIDPSTIPTLCTIKCLIIGAIHISD